MMINEILEREKLILEELEKLKNKNLLANLEAIESKQIEILNDIQKITSVGKESGGSKTESEEI